MDQLKGSYRVDRFTLLVDFSQYYQNVIILNAKKAPDGL
jgi:hypothetical protein